MMKCVVMGVSGCGKSVLGASLAEKLGVVFQDADDFHSAANRAKMMAGQSLTDEDRWPWLDAVAQALQSGGIMACSALKRSYRDRLRQGAGPMQFLHLSAPRDVIATRLAQRQGHFMPTSLLDSQFATLEALGPDEGHVLDARQPPDAVLQQALRCLGLRGNPPP